MAERLSKAQTVLQEIIYLGQFSATNIHLLMLMLFPSIDCIHILQGKVNGEGGMEYNIE